MLNRQYSRVIRWINRAQTLSADGNYSDAILDVECARAELDNARQELLLCHKTGSERKRLARFPLASLTALFAVLFYAAPIKVVSADALPAPMFADISEEIHSASLVLPSVTMPVIAETQSESGAPQEGAAADVGSNMENNDKKLLANYPDNSLATAKKRESVRLSDKDVYRLVEVGRKALLQKNELVVLEFN